MQKMRPSLGPRSTPLHVTSRQCRNRVFSGNLSGPVGLEKHFVGFPEVARGGSHDCALANQQLPPRFDRQSNVVLTDEGCRRLVSIGAWGSGFRLTPRV